MQAPTRYAVRQVLDQELQKTIALREAAARQARFKAGNAAGVHDEYQFDDDKENVTMKAGTKTKEFFATGTGGSDVKRDFFGRVIVEKPAPLGQADGNAGAGGEKTSVKPAIKVWVTFHEGQNNAVRKPISLKEFLRGL
jgi:chromosome transmission fidelity protein 18